MIQMPLSEAADALDARLIGSDLIFAGVSTDTRSIKRGELFCALQGPNFDAHDHCGEAAGKGAAGALVERDPGVNMPLLLVDDSRRALGRLAGTWRGRFNIPVVGITGSNGKTTVKEMLSAILALDGPVCATIGNLNNDIGVPQTLFRLAESDRYAVIEMGANHAGEIAYLAGLARPAVGVITLCAPAHLEGFGSVDNVARAKGELYTALPMDGTAVINADDEYAGFWSGLAGARNVLRFAIEQPADIRAHDIINKGAGAGMCFTLALPDARIDVELPFDGAHNVSNALAAAAAAVALGVPAVTIKRGLEQAHRVAGRLAVLTGTGGARILDDTYNANPTSLRAALAVLAGEPGKKWLALGDMGELGSRAADLHREAGLDARAAGVERLYAYGELAAAAAEAFGDGAGCYEDMQELIDALSDEIEASVTLLVKGSRTARMERVTQALRGVA